MTPTEVVAWSSTAGLIAGFVGGALWAWVGFLLEHRGGTIDTEQHEGGD